MSNLIQADCLFRWWSSSSTQSFSCPSSEGISCAQLGVLGGGKQAGQPMSPGRAAAAATKQIRHNGIVKSGGTDRSIGTRGLFTAGATRFPGAYNARALRPRRCTCGSFCRRWHRRVQNSLGNTRRRRACHRPSQRWNYDRCSKQEVIYRMRITSEAAKKRHFVRSSENARN